MEAADYKFVYVDIRAQGKCSYGGIFSRSSFGKALRNNKLNIPKSVEIPNSTEKVPYVIFGDEAFPLMTNLMRPYPVNFLSEEKCIYNFTLYRYGFIKKKNKFKWVSNSQYDLQAE